MKVLKLILLLLLLSSTAYAWGVVVSSGGVAAVGVSCGASPLIHNDSVGSTSSGLSAFVTNSSSIQICKVTFWATNTTGAASSDYVQIRTAPNGGGTQIGGNSGTVNIPSGTTESAEFEVTWSSDYPNPTGDYYVWPVRGRSHSFGYNTGNPLAGATLYIGETEYATWDMAFSLYIME